MKNIQKTFRNFLLNFLMRLIAGITLLRLDDQKVIFVQIVNLVNIGLRFIALNVEKNFQ